MLESFGERRRLVHHPRFAGSGRTGRPLLRSEWRLYFSRNVRLELVFGRLQLVDATKSGLARDVGHKTSVFFFGTVRVSPLKRGTVAAGGRGSGLPKCGGVRDSLPLRGSPPRKGIHIHGVPRGCRRGL